MMIFCCFLSTSVSSAGHGIVQLRKLRRYPRGLPGMSAARGLVTDLSPSLSSTEAAVVAAAGSSSSLSLSSISDGSSHSSSSKSKDGRGLSVLHSLSDYPAPASAGASLHGNNNHHQHHHSFNDASGPSSSSSFDWTKNGHDVPVFVSEALNEPHNMRVSSLLDRAIVRAPWNVLTAKLFRIVAIFFLESYLVQLFGVSLPLD